MTDYTIRDRETGAVICTGYTAASEEEAVSDFLADHPLYREDWIYVSESGWND